MAHLICLPRHIDNRGSLTVLDNIEELLPFTIKRVFFINAETDVSRGGHRHHTTKQAAICIRGECVVTNNDGKTENSFLLDNPGKCLLLEACDWHVVHSFAPHSILLVFASENFDPADYIYEPYKKSVNGSI